VGVVVVRPLGPDRPAAVVPGRGELGPKGPWGAGLGALAAAGAGRHARGRRSTAMALARAGRCATSGAPPAGEGGG